MRYSSFAWLLLLAACGDDDSSGNPDAPPIDAPDGVPRERAGHVELTEDLWVFTEDAGGDMYRNARLDARFYDGREPQFHREVMRGGDCALRTFTLASCAPACTDALCIDTNVCESWPTYVSAGRLTVQGLRTPIAIDPRDGWYYTDEPLPTDLFADDASVTAALAGATVPALSMTATAVPPITPDITGGKVVVAYPAAGPLEVRWTPAAPGARVRLTLNSNNRGHGAPFDGIIECEVSDEAGLISVPAALLDGFPATEAWSVCAGSDCPPSNLKRYRRAAAAVGEREVELRVASSFTFGIEHRVPR
jgi:hypothetical protein